MKNKRLSNKKLKELYIEVLHIAAFERGNRRNAQRLLRHILAEMLLRGM